MPHDLYPAGTPRFNHVAMSMPADALDEEGRAAITGFWGDVFGFEEHQMLTEDRHKLVLGACHYEQFVFLISEDEPMRAPRLDHFGLSVSSLEDLQSAYDRAAAWKEKDDAVDLIAPEVEDHGMVKIHNFYAGYRLPMMCEIQYWEFAER